MAVAREQLISEAHARVDLHQVVDRRAVWGEGTAQTRVWRGP